MKNLLWLSAIQGTPMGPRRRISPCGATATFGSALSLTYLAKGIPGCHKILGRKGMDGKAMPHHIQFSGDMIYEFCTCYIAAIACLFDLVTYQFYWDSLKPPTRCFWTAICWHYPDLMPSILMLFGSNTTTWYRWVYIGCQHNISVKPICFEFWHLMTAGVWYWWLLLVLLKTVPKNRSKGWELSHQCCWDLLRISGFIMPLTPMIIMILGQFRLAKNHRCFRGSLYHHSGVAADHLHSKSHVAQMKAKWV